MRPVGAACGGMLAGYPMSTSTDSEQGFLLSVVLPVYNEEESIAEMLTELVGELQRQGYRYEVVCVNDGSRDRSWDILLEHANRNPRIKLIGLSRNFGHQNAVSAGLAVAEGDAVVIMDADLQDPPAVIPEMVAQWQQGHDVVYGQRRSRRGDGLMKRLTARLFYAFIDRLSDVRMPRDAGDFRLVSRRVVDQYNRLAERNRYIRGLVTWFGYNQTAVLFDRHPRFAGSTKYSLGKMIRLGLAGLTSFSVKPLYLSVVLGFVLSLALVGFLVFWLVFYAMGGYVERGWTSLVVIILACAAINCFLLGILGAYVGQVVREVKQRPLYLTDQRVNFPPPDAPESRQP